MTDDKGAGEGPYFHRCGTPGEKSNCTACAYEEGRKAAEKNFKESKRFDELPVLKCSADALHGLLCSNYFWAVSSYPRMGYKIHDGEVGAIFAIVERDRDGKQYWQDFFIMNFIARVVMDKRGIK